MAIDMKRIEGKACVSTALLCEYFGVTKQAVNKWEKLGCPKAARGFWCVADVLAWKGEQANPDTDSIDSKPLKEQKMYWETRCREAQSENQSLKNAILRGDYLEKEQMHKELSTFFITLKQAVLSLPRKAAVTASLYLGNEPARKMESDMMEVIVDALRQWSWGEFSPPMDQRGADSPAAAGSDHRHPVGRRKPNSGRQEQQ